MTIRYIFQIDKGFAPCSRLMPVFFDGGTQILIQPKELIRHALDVRIVFKIFMPFKELSEIRICQAILLVRICLSIRPDGELGEYIDDVVEAHFAHFSFF